MFTDKSIYQMLCYGDMNPVNVAPLIKDSFFLTFSSSQINNINPNLATQILDELPKNALY